MIDESILVDPDDETRFALRPFVRNMRARFVPGTIRCHTDELYATVKYPWGAAWRRAGDMWWCPVCMSVSPRSALRIIRNAELWDQDESVAQMQALVDTGEMEASEENWERAHSPTPGTAYGYYNFGVDGPIQVVFNIPMRGQFVLAVPHFIDIDNDELASLLMHINRIAPMVEWTIHGDGSYSWAQASIAILHPSPEGDEQQGTADE